MHEDQSYAKKPKNIFIRLTLNIVFVLPILLFLALQYYEYHRASSLRKMLLENAPQLKQEIALISYDFFDKVYLLENIVFINEASEIALTIGKAKIEEFNLNKSKEEDFLYNWLELENIVYTHPQIGIVNCEYYKENKRKNLDIANFFNTQFFLPTLTQADFISFLSDFQVADLELEKLKYNYISSLGKGELSLASFSLQNTTIKNEKFSHFTTKNLLLEHRNFYKDNNSLLQIEEMRLKNVKEIDFYTLSTLHTQSSFKKKFFPSSFIQENEDLKQEIYLKNLKYFLDNEKILAFESMDSSLCIPAFFGNKSSIKNLEITPALFAYFQESFPLTSQNSVAFPTNKESKKHYFYKENLFATIDFEYILAASLKEVDLALQIESSLFSGKINLSFLLPEDVFTLFENNDYFFGILLSKANFSYTDNGLAKEIVQYTMEENYLNIVQARQKLYELMPNSELLKIFYNEGTLDINLESGKVLGISDVYGLLLYPQSSNFEIKYKAK